jgi:hypothetical protein
VRLDPFAWSWVCHLVRCFSSIDITVLKRWIPVLCHKENPEPARQDGRTIEREMEEIFLHCLKIVLALSHHCVLSL